MFDFFNFLVLSDRSYDIDIGILYSNLVLKCEWGVYLR